jgi:hypothetical protein
MYCTARRCVLPSLSQEQRDGLLAEAALQSISKMFEAVPDPRSAHVCWLLILSVRSIRPLRALSQVSHSLSIPQ